MKAIASFKSLARDTCGQVLFHSGATAPAVRLRKRLSIVTFHRVLTEPQRQLYHLPGIVITPDELDAHLKFATRHFRCLSLAAALDLWTQERCSGPPLLAITFDDGYLDNYQNALPVLERHGVTASFYIPSQILEDPTPLWYDALATSVAQLMSHLATEANLSAPSLRERAGKLLAELQSGQGYEQSESSTEVEAALELTKQWSPVRRNDWIGRVQELFPRHMDRSWDGFMDVEQMRDLIARGHEIGSHSHSHPLLPQCTAKELLDEIVGSKQRLESALGAPITTFCYPNGSIDKRTVSHVREAGYRAAVTTQWGSNSGGQDPYQLQRFDMVAKHAEDRKGRFSDARLAWRMSGWYPGLWSAKHDLHGGTSAG